MIKRLNLFKAETHLNRDELDGFRKILFQIHLLMLVLVIFYFLLRDRNVLETPAVLLTLVGFLLLIFSIHFLLARFRYNDRTIFIENAVLVAFITLMLRYSSEGIYSPLIFLYSLVIIISAMTLNERITILKTLLISVCCVYISPIDFSVKALTYTVIVLFPFWLLAYLSIRLTIYKNITRKRFKQMAEEDEITSLLNIRTFNVLSQQVVRRCMRYHFPFSVIMIDADNLKQVNDIHGHAAGTAFIQHVAEIIRGCLRHNDIVARFGGDEFIILLPQTGTIPTQVVAQRIREELQKTPLKFQDLQIFITVSIGIASYPDHGRKYSEISGRADKALYESKARGKDCVTVYSREFG